MRESALQAIIVKYLTEHGFLVIHIPNELTRGRITCAGILPGAPDLLVLKNGHIAFVEVKTPSGRLTNTQKIVHDRIKQHGFDVFIVRSLDDLNDVVSKFPS